MATAGSTGAGAVIGAGQLCEQGRAASAPGSVPQRSRSGYQRSSTVTDGSEEPQVGACPAQAAGMMHAESNLVPKPGRRRRAADRQQPVSVTTGAPTRKPWRILTSDPAIHCTYLGFLTRLPHRQHHAVPCAKAQCRSRTEKARGSNPLTSAPKHSRSGRRRSSTGGALVVLRAAWGHAGATPGPPAQPEDSVPGSAWVPPWSASRRSRSAASALGYLWPYGPG